MADFAISPPIEFPSQPSTSKVRISPRLAICHVRASRALPAYVVHSEATDMADASLRNTRALGSEFTRTRVLCLSPRPLDLPRCTYSMMRIRNSSQSILARLPRQKSTFVYASNSLLITSSTFPVGTSRNFLQMVVQNLKVAWRNFALRWLLAAALYHRGTRG